MSKTIARPSVSEVSKVLISKKLTNHSLYDKNPNQWSDFDLKTWVAIKEDREIPEKKTQSGNATPEQKRLRTRHASKIMRISDGHIFFTQIECKEKEGLSERALRKELEKGTVYKRLKEKKYDNSRRTKK